MPKTNMLTQSPKALLTFENNAGISPVTELESLGHRKDPDGETDCGRNGTELPRGKEVHLDFSGTSLLGLPSSDRILK